MVEGGLALGDFVGVVDGNVVDAASVDVDGLAKFGVDNARTFDGPAGVARLIEIVPVHVMLFSRFDKFPEGEIGGSTFFGVELDAGAGFEVL